MALHALSAARHKDGRSLSFLFQAEPGAPHVHARGTKFFPEMTRYDIPGAIKI